MNPYLHLVTELTRHAREGKSFPLGGGAPAPRPALAPDAPRALIFAPHPDDECIIGGLPLRLLREARLNVINLAVTQGSKKERQAERWQELQAACNYLGFGLEQTLPNGLEKVNVRTREQEPTYWWQSVEIIADALAQHEPRVIFFPHEQDWNSTHIGVHFLVMDALRTMPIEFACFLVETEFWGAMATPNLMVESSVADVADLMTGTSFHVGEVKRNPYHLSLPAWLQDNVRRGGELVGGQGGAAPDFTFATLYRLRRWQRGRVEKFYEGGRLIGCGGDVAGLFV